MIPRPHKNFRTCEYCKVRPCYFRATGNVEYGDHCKFYKEDKEKTKYERR